MQIQIWIPNKNQVFYLCSSMSQFRFILLMLKYMLHLLGEQSRRLYTQLNNLIYNSYLPSKLLQPSTVDVYIAPINVAWRPNYVKCMAPATSYENKTNYFPHIQCYHMTFSGLLICIFLHENEYAISLVTSKRTHFGSLVKEHTPQEERQFLKITLMAVLLLLCLQLLVQGLVNFYVGSLKL